MTSTPMPQTPNTRRETIRDVLASEQIDSQRELRERLADKGIEVTWATLSRDLVGMQATKAHTAEGSRVYSVPDIDGALTHEGEGGRLRLQKWYQTLLVTSVLADHQLILRTTVGEANLLGSAINAVRLEEITGMIADDDMILVICRGAADARATQKYLMELAEPDQMLGLDWTGTPGLS